MPDASTATDERSDSIVLGVIPQGPASIRAKEVIDGLAGTVKPNTVKSSLKRLLADGQIAQDRSRGPYYRPAPKTRTYAPSPRPGISAEDGERYRAANGERSYVAGDLVRFRLPGGPTATVRLVIVQDGPPLDVAGELGSAFAAG